MVNNKISLQNGLVGSPCSPSDSQESSPAPQSDKHLEVHLKLDGNIHVVPPKHRFQKDTVARKQGSFVHVGFLNEHFPVSKFGLTF